MPTVTSQPGNTLAARTGEMQQRPMGLPSLWKACRAAFTSSLTEQSLPCTAHVHRFFAAPKPPEKNDKTRESRPNFHFYHPEQHLLRSEGGQNAREQTWEYNGIVVFDTELRQILDITTGESCALHQNVSFLLRCFAFQVIHYVHLVDVGSKHFHL